MRPFSRVSLLFVLVLLVASLAATKNSMPNLQAFKNSAGVHRTFSKAGSIDLSNAFFQPLGTNGRSCVTCHAAEDAWSITPDHLQQRFNVDGGLDPVFRPVDGANCPSADVSTADARRSAYSMLLKKGVIRVSLPIPAAAEFTVVSIDDPYSCAETTKDNLAFFRRPLPAANLPFLTTVMWDGRESFAANTLAQNLSHQAMDATLGHAQGAASPTAQQLKEIVDFETQLYTAQTESDQAGELNGQGGNGGPAALGAQKFYLGINDALGGDPTGAAFDASAMTIFGKWADLKSSPNAKYTDARLAVARGEKIFNTLPIHITGVKGLNDALHVDDITGTCSTCHDSPNVGNHSVPLAIDIGLNDASRRTPDVPLYTLRNNITGETVQVTDAGRAMITGKWADIGKSKGPVLRALSARAPYFHNGSAATLDDAIQFYEDRFHLGLTPEERKDLVAFLEAL